jgi:pilus assembly protein CpaF
MNDQANLETRIRNRLLSKLESQSRDTPTGLLHQAAFIQRSQRILNNARSANQTAALLLGDIDDFRQVNTVYGHETGDRVLAGIAALLKQGTGEADLVGRWGGEEFVILLSNVNEQEAMETAGRIRQSIEDRAFESDDGREVRATISIGAALFSRHGGDIVTLVERAERAVRMAKREGKNKLHLYSKLAGPGEMRAQIEELFDAVLAEEKVELSKAERQRLLNAVSADVLGLGPLESLLADDTVDEVMVNGHDRLYVGQSGRLQNVPSGFRDNEHLMEVIRTIVQPLGRRVDESAPMVDARLPDGSRVNVVIPPISLVGPVLTIRKFAKKPLTTGDLFHFGFWNEDMVQFLRACVHARLNIVVAGGTGSGKTTVLNLVAGMIPDDERIVTVENAAELQLPQKHVVTLESRPPNIEGKGEISIRDLVINSLRMRADRIVVGEVQSAEALDLFQAMNTGHDGSMMTVHASSPRDVLVRLETMTTMANLSLPLLTIRQMMASAIDLITYQERLQDGTRKLLKVTEVVGMQGDVVMLQDIFEFRQTGVRDGKITGHHTAAGHIPRFLDRIQAAGIELPLSLFTPS